MTRIQSLTTCPQQKTKDGALVVTATILHDPSLAAMLPFVHTSPATEGWRKVRAVTGEAEGSAFGGVRPCKCQMVDPRRLRPWFRISMFPIRG